MKHQSIDETDRKIINALQGGFPISERPYLAAADRIEISEDELIARLGRLVDERVLSRFGPMYDAEKMGGAVTLCAMAVPDERFDEVADIVNGRREVAHNYARTHDLNMWFVVASDDPADLARIIAGIEADTGLKVFDFPKQEEFFIGLWVNA
jgi:DNA-binding Lrp family transcriptional regulator